MTAARPQVTILTSAVGLGLYIPALLVQRQLRTRQIAADVQVIEGYYMPSFQRAHLAQRDAHHASFALAQLAHRMARGVEHCLDDARVHALLAHWRQEKRRRFVVWAGFWLPVIERYRRMLGGQRVEVDHCRIDAVVSASFNVHRDLDNAGRSIWLWNSAQNRIDHEIRVTNAPPVPFAARDDRLVVHGGGWNIGTYRAAAHQLARTAYALDLVVHDFAEVPSLRPVDRAFMLDPDWCAWERDAADMHAFPPMVELVGKSAIRFPENADYHSMHERIRASKAIVSKPGGCTLIDSLGAATPVILLEPYGYAEEKNARIWEDLGFGMSYAMWRETGYDAAVLRRLHLNILERTRGVDYPNEYAEQLGETCG